MFNNYKFIKKPNKEQLLNLKVNNNCGSLFVNRITCINAIMFYKI